MTRYLNAPIVASNARRSGSLLPPAELWLRGDKGLVTDGAVDFVATDYAHLRGNNFAWNLAGSWWCCGWMYPRSNATTGGTSSAVRYFVGGNMYDGCNIGYRNDSQSITFPTKTESGGAILPGFTAPINQWYFWMVHFNFRTSTWSFKINDQPMHSGVRPAYALTNENLLIGTTSTGSGSFDGLIDTLVFGEGDSDLSFGDIYDFMYNNGNGRIGHDIHSWFIVDSGIKHIYDMNEEKGARKCRLTNVELIETAMSITTPTGTSYGTNLVPNPTFNAGIQNTTVANAGGSGGVITHNTVDPISGNGDLLLTYSGDGTFTQYPRPTTELTTVKPSTRYRWRCKTRVRGGNVRSPSSVLMYVGGTSHSVSGSQPLTGDQDWNESILTQISFPHNNAFFQFNGAVKEGGTVSIDDWYIDQIITGVRNGGFEQIGSVGQPFEDWFSLRESVGVREVHRDLAEKRTGDASCRLSNLQLNSDMVLGIRQTGFSASKIYRISGWAKSSVAGMRVVARSGVTVLGEASVGTGWAPFTFNAIRNATNVIDLTLHAVDQSSNVFNLWIDDVTIVVAEILSAPGVAAGRPQNNDQVTSIADEITGSQLSLSQPVVANRPTYRTSQIDDHSVLEFDGAGDFLSTTGFEIEGHREFYAIIKLLETGGTSEFLGSAVSQWDHCVQRIGNAVRTAVANGGITPPVNITSPEINVSAAGCGFTLMKSWVEPNMQGAAKFGLRFGNVILEAGGQRWVNTKLRGIRIGRGSQRFQLAELIVFSKKLTFEQEQSLLGYFKHRYPSVEITL